MINDLMQIKIYLDINDRYHYYQLRNLGLIEEEREYLGFINYIYANFGVNAQQEIKNIQKNKIHCIIRFNQFKKGE